MLEFPAPPKSIALDDQGVWKSGYTWRDRLEYIRKNYDQFSFEKWTDVLAEVRGDRFSGYASELIN